METSEDKRLIASKVMENDTYELYLSVSKGKKTYTMTTSRGSITRKNLSKELKRFFNLK